MCKMSSSSQYVVFCTCWRRNDQHWWVQAAHSVLQNKYYMMQYGVEHCTLAYFAEDCAACPHCPSYRIYNLSVIVAHPLLALCSHTCCQNSWVAFARQEKKRTLFLTVYYQVEALSHAAALDHKAHSRIFLFTLEKDKEMVTGFVSGVYNQSRQDVPKDIL